MSMLDRKVVGQVDHVFPAGHVFASAVHVWNTHPRFCRITCVVIHWICACKQCYIPSGLGLRLSKSESSELS